MEPPTEHGVFSRIVATSPGAIKPYLKLMRFDKQIGTLLFFAPFSWSVASATPAGSLPDLYHLLIMAGYCLIMRGFGCTVNDVWDRDIDNKVDRTKTRPLANGDLNVTQALLFSAGQLAVGVALLNRLNSLTVYLGLFSVALGVVYPLMKRVTYWPQLVLGLAFNWGALMGYSAIKGHVNWPVCLPLYAAGICWTLIYDTIYAHQDKRDDVLVGVKSTALKFDEDTKVWLGGFATTMIGSLVMSGVMNDQTWPYYAGVALTAGHILKQMVTLKIDDAGDCGEKFRSNSIVGLLLFVGSVMGVLLKRIKD